MKFDPPLKKARLIKRYKRFLCDVSLNANDFDGQTNSESQELTMHCPNTGSMKNCCPDNADIWYSTSLNAKRKYPNTWEIVQTPDGHKIGINSRLANDIVVEAIENGIVPELTGYSQLKSEVKYGKENSRIDIVLEHDSSENHEDKALTYIEVKSLTLREDDGVGYFPDSISTRGQKHLRELITMVEQGHRAVLFFCVQHTGINEVKAAAHIDADYAKLLHLAQLAGVEVLAYGCDINEHEIVLSRRLQLLK